MLRTNNHLKSNKFVGDVTKRGTRGPRQRKIRKGKRCVFIGGTESKIYEEEE